MSFGDAIKSGFKNFAKFEGRARRSEFWFWQLFIGLIYVGLYVVIGLLSVATSSMDYYGGMSAFATTVTGVLSLLSIGAFIALIVPTLSVLVRRLHDTNRSGAYYFMSWIPLVGGIFMLVYTIEDSRPGDNQYGPYPKV